MAITYFINRHSVTLKYYGPDGDNRVVQQKYNVGQNFKYPSSDTKKGNKLAKLILLIYNLDLLYPECYRLNM